MSRKIENKSLFSQKRKKRGQFLESKKNICYTVEVFSDK